MKWPRFFRLGPQAAAGEPLAPVDAAWLRMERPDNPMTVTSAMLFDQPLEHGRLLDVAARAVRDNLRFRQRISQRSSRQPSWELVTQVELGEHVHRVTLPPPGGEAELRALVGQLVSRPLARARPLWQVWHVEGYQGGSAVVTQLHHAIGDGAALVRLLLTLATAATAPPHAARRHAPMLRVADLPRHPAATAAAIRHLLALADDPATSLQGELGTDKRVAWSGPIPIERLRALGQRLGATTNDVLLSSLAGALARVLGAHSQPGRRVLHALVPVDLREGAPEGQLGNRFGLVFAPLAIDQVSPRERLRSMAGAMTALKRSPEAALSLLILAALGALAPPRLYDLVVRYFARKATLVVTNVPGPTQRLELAGQSIRALLVWAPQSARLGLGVSLLSYHGEARIGVAADARLCPEPERLVVAFEDELDRLGT